MDGSCDDGTAAVSVRVVEITRTECMELERRRETNGSNQHELPLLSKRMDAKHHVTFMSATHLRALATKQLMFVNARDASKQVSPLDGGWEVISDAFGSLVSDMFLLLHPQNSSCDPLAPKHCCDLLPLCAVTLSDLSATLGSSFVREESPDSSTSTSSSFVFQSPQSHSMKHPSSYSRSPSTSSPSISRPPLSPAARPSSVVPPLVEKLPSELVVYTYRNHATGLGEEETVESALLLSGLWLAHINRITVSCAQGTLASLGVVDRAKELLQLPSDGQLVRHLSRRTCNPTEEWIDLNSEPPLSASLRPLRAMCFADAQRNPSSHIGCAYPAAVRPCVERWGVLTKDVEVKVRTSDDADNASRCGAGDRCGDGDGITHDMLGETACRLRTLFASTFGGDGGGIERLVGTEAPRRSIFFHGPSGSGKTALLSKLTRSLGLSLFTVSPATLSGLFPGDQENGLRQLIALAKRQSPCVLVLDDCEVMFPQNDVDSDAPPLLPILVEELLEADADPRVPAVLLVCTTHLPHRVNPSLLDCVTDYCDLNMPTPAERESMFSFCSGSANGPPSGAMTAKSMSAACPGYTLGDVASLHRTMAHVAMMKKLLQKDGRGVSDNGMRDEIESEEVLLFQQSKKLLNKKMLSSTGEKVGSVVPNVRWEDIGGYDDVKAQLKECVVWVYKNPDAFRRMGIVPVQGLLLYGPPGTGKTMLAKAVATESNATFYALDVSDVIRPMVGDSEKIIADTFRMARLHVPCVVFLDEIQAVFGSRETAGSSGKKITSQLLLELDGLAGSGVFLLAATNCPDALDASLFRPGRLDRAVYVPPPKPSERCDILRLHLAKMPLAYPDVDTSNFLRLPLVGVNSEKILAEWVAGRTEGYTGADLVNLCRSAAITAIQSECKNVHPWHFLEALQHTRATVSFSTLRQLELWRPRKRLGS